MLPVSALSVCSVLSKFMGKYPGDWERHLRGISDRGYNMIHHLSGAEVDFGSR